MSVLVETYGYHRTGGDAGALRGGGGGSDPKRSLDEAWAALIELAERDERHDDLDDIVGEEGRGRAGEDDDA